MLLKKQKIATCNAAQNAHLPLAVCWELGMGSGFSHIETKVRSLQPTAVVTAGSDPQPELQCERPVALWWWKNPRTSALWRQAPLCNVVKQPGVCFADLDLCQYGMSSMVDGAPLRKSISSLTNDSTFASSIEAKCDQSHEHRAHSRPRHCSVSRVSTCFRPSSVQSIVPSHQEQTTRGAVSNSYGCTSRTSAGT